MIKRHVDLSEAPGGAETRSHLTACESEASHYGPNLSIYSGAFPPRVRRRKLNATGLWVEQYTFVEAAFEREVSKGKCRRLEGVTWG